MASLARCYNIHDLRLRAKSFLPKGIFEYVDRGAEDEVAVVENLEAFKCIKLKTHFMVDLRKMDLSTTIFGKRWSFPYAVSPTGTTGLLWYQGEIVLAKACGKHGIPFTLGTNAITSIDEVMRACPETNIWFQLYMWSEEEDSYALVRRARDAGCQTLIVTIDGALGNNREYNKRNGFSVPFTLSPRSAYDMLTHPRWFAGVLGRYVLNNGMPTHENYPERYRHRITTRTSGNPMRHRAMTWADISKLREFWNGPLVVKGILRPEDAEAAIQAGADGIVVSNHGGRALDSAIPTIDMLPQIAAVVNKRALIFLDSGIRRGGDIVKALALGADAVMAGRPTLYGIGAGGQAGGEKALAILHKEFEKVMAYVGCRNLAELSSDVLAYPPRGLPARGLAAE